MTIADLAIQMKSTSRAARLYAAGTLLAAAVMCLRIVSTYPVFTQVYDEPVHIACGMQWLDKGVYNYDALHPPLSRIAAVIGVYLAGERSHGIEDYDQEGNAILGKGARYKRNLALARLGELPFAALAFAGVWVWARRYFGPSAFFSALLFSMLPPVLAHGGLATTDISVTASCTWAFYAFTRFLEEHTWRTSLVLGFWCGIALLSKFSAILFLGCGFLVISVIYIACGRQPRHTVGAMRMVRLLAPALIVSSLLVWACFRFTFAPVLPSKELEARSARVTARGYTLPPTLTQPGFIHTLVTKVPVPASRFFLGLGQVWWNNKVGRWAYLIGQRRDSGWWYFFPVVLALKTPLGFLILALCGDTALLMRLRHRDWVRAAPALFAIVILLVCLPSRMDLGVRYVLPLYPLLSIAAGYFIADSIVRSLRPRTAFALGCLLWCCFVSLRAHPDYIASFNEIASGHAEHFRVDSDLDWGQDLWRLSKRLKELHAPSVALSYFGTADLTRFELPPVNDIPCNHPLNGYVAVSVTNLYLEDPECFVVLQKIRPTERIGKSIFLYRFQKERLPDSHPDWLFTTLMDRRLGAVVNGLP